MRTDLTTGSKYHTSIFVESTDHHIVNKTENLGR